MDEIAGLTRYPLARRGMVMSSLISGFTLAVAPVEAQVIHTDTTGLVVGEVKIPSGDIQMPAYFARPAGAGPHPTVLVNEEIFGVHEHIKDLCRRLAKAGYFAVAPEIYAREGDLATMTDPAQIVRDVISKTPDAQIMSDLDNTVDWAGKNGGDIARLGSTGWCRGGRVTWLYDAHATRLKAAVAWYGPIGGQRSPIQPQTVEDVATQIHAPILCLYSGQDESSPVPQLEALAAKVRQAGKSIEVKVYPNAPHGFNADYRPSYRKADAEDAWSRMLAWFKQHGVA